MVIKELFAKLGLEVDGKGFEIGEALIKGLERGLVATSIAVVGIVGGLVEMARETANAGVEADRAAQRVGVTTDAIQELHFAAEASGVPVEALETALFRMSNAAYMAKHGAMQAADAFRGLLTADELKNDSPDQMLEKLADGFIKIKDPTERAHKVMAIFGRGGAALLPLLNKGAAGIEEFRREAHELGVVLDADAIAKSKEFKLAAHLLEARLVGLRNTIGVKVLGALLSFGRAMSRATAAVKAFKDAHVDGVFQTVKVALILLTAATVAWGLLSAAAAATAVAGFWAAGTAAVVTAAKAILAWGLAALPFIAVAAGVAVLLLWLEDLYQFLTGGESVIGDFVASIKDGLMGKDGAKGLFMDFMAWVMHFFPDSFATAAGDAAAEVVEALTGAWDKVRTLFSHPINTIFGGGQSPAVSPGAASPTASVGSSVNTASAGPSVVAPSLSANFVVNASPGMDAKDVAGQVRTAIDEWYDSTMRATAEGVS